MEFLKHVTEYETNFNSTALRFSQSYGSHNTILTISYILLRQCFNCAKTKTEYCVPPRGSWRCSFPENTISYANTKEKYYLNVPVDLIENKLIELRLK